MTASEVEGLTTAIAQPTVWINARFAVAENSQVRARPQMHLHPEIFWCGFARDWNRSPSIAYPLKRLSQVCFSCAVGVASFWRSPRGSRGSALHTRVACPSHEEKNSRKIILHVADSIRGYACAGGLSLNHLRFSSPPLQAETPAQWPASP